MQDGLPIDEAPASSPPPSPAPASLAPASLAPGDVLRAHQLRPKKSWGQNFLTDPQVHRAVIDAIGLPAGAAPATVLELGAGLGALTEHLLADPRVGRVLAVERDRELLPLLQARFADATHLKVLAADAGRLDFAALHAAHGPLYVVGNLPYHLACRILVNLAAVAEPVLGIGVLVQREVGLRMAAPPGNGRSLLAVLLQRRFLVTPCRDVPPGAFFPPPKVRSMVVSLRPHPPGTSDCPTPGADADAAGIWVARVAFAGRRKTLLNTLSRACGVDKPRLIELLRALPLAPERRPESLPTETFFALGAALRAQNLLPADFAGLPAAAADSAVDSDAAP
jgi:16S rRNA (adenine1518-N6/adenine1519-N6)-dimethyltransferase